VPEPEVAEIPQRPGRTAFDRRPPRPSVPAVRGARGASARPAARRPAAGGDRVRAPRPAEYKTIELPANGETGAKPAWKSDGPTSRPAASEGRRPPSAPRTFRPAAASGERSQSNRPNRPEWKGAKPGTGAGKPAWKSRPTGGDARPSWKRASATSALGQAPSRSDADRPRDFKPRPSAGKKPFGKPFAERGERSGARPLAGGAKPAWKARAPRSEGKPAWNREGRPPQQRSTTTGPGAGRPRDFKPRPPGGGKPFSKPFSERRERTGASQGAGAGKPAWKDRGKPPIKDRSAKPRWDRPRSPSEGRASTAEGSKPREYRLRPAGGRPASSSGGSRPAGPRSGPGGPSRPRSDKPRTFSSKPRPASGGDSRSGDRRSGAKSSRPPYPGKGKPSTRSKSGFPPKKRPE
jgi:23S rRNA pseudouridine2605 synthase